MKPVKNIYIEKTPKTPEVDFNQQTGDLILDGRSIPENASKLYEPLLDWIGEYVKSPKLTTNLRLKLEYFNTASSIWLAKMVNTLSKIDKQDSVLIVHLYFDAEDFDTMDLEELRDIVSLLSENTREAKTSIGVKAYGTGKDGRIVKESTIFI